MGYTPYKMKASGHNNSPIEKNYGSKSDRGIGVPFTGGVGSNEMESGVGDKFEGMPYSENASPAKGWLKDMGKKIAGGAKKFMKGEGALGLLNPVGRGISEIQKAKEKKAQAAQESAAASAGAAGGGGDLEGRVAALESGGGNAGGGGKPLAAQMLAGAGGAKTGMFGGMMPGGMGGGPMATAMKPKKNLAEGWGGTGGATGLPIV